MFLATTTYQALNLYSASFEMHFSRIAISLVRRFMEAISSMPSLKNANLTMRI